MDLHELKFQANRCIAYHSMRVTFFEGLSKLIGLFAFVSSSASIATLIAANGTLFTISLIATAFLTGFQIVVGTGDRAKDHAVYRNKFYNFLTKLEKIGEEEEIQIRKLSARLQILYSETPPYFTALNYMADNLACNVVGQPGRQIQIPWRHRVLAHFYPFSGYYICGKDRHTIQEPELS